MKVAAKRVEIFISENCRDELDACGPGSSGGMDCVRPDRDA